VLLVILDDVSTMPTHVFSQLPGVEKVIRTQPQCSLVLKDGIPAVSVGGRLAIGGNCRPVVIAGPCSVEGQAHVLQVARAVKDCGADMLRGGAFKPRTSPYEFQGLGKDALKYLAEARTATGLPVVSEVMSAEQVELAEPFVDMFQIGARNMYNYELLREVGRTQRPVLLKRGMSATIQELLNAAEYILLEGNMQVVLCERGIRTFETYTRNTLDLSAVVALKSMTPLPVIVDPSHATGRRDLIRPLSRAAIACGADGLLIEVHETPCHALSDGEQAVTSSTLREIIQDVQAIHGVLTRDMAPPTVPVLPVAAGAASSIAH
jgi:3-deoxy-7-phosphoheptulonate synthase